MTTRTSSRTSSHRDTDTDTTGAQARAQALQGASALEGSRQQLAFGADMTAHWLASCQALGVVNQHMLERVALMHRQAAESIRAATTGEELLAAQASLAASAWQDSMRYWQDLLMAGLRAVPAAGPEAAGAAPGSAGDMAAAAVHAAAPVMKAWQSMFATPLNGAASAAH